MQQPVRSASPYRRPAEGRTGSAPLCARDQTADAIDFHNGCSAADGSVYCGTAALSAGAVLEDLSGVYTPKEWARKAIGAYHKYKADRIIAETNYGGDMVESTLRSVDDTIPFGKVTASRGKVVRAEPVSALSSNSEFTMSAASRCFKIR